MRSSSSSSRQAGVGNLQELLSPAQSLIFTDTENPSRVSFLQTHQAQLQNEAVLGVGERTVLHSHPAVPKVTQWCYPELGVLRHHGALDALDVVTERR